MNLAKKLQLAKKAVDNIARHDDEDAAVRKVFLDQVEEHIKGEREAIDARVAERVKSLTKVD